MSLEGTVIDGKLVLDNGQTLANGTPVEVVVKEPETKPTLAGLLLRLAGTIDDLPSDMARNHDHYLYGTPKK